MVIAREETRLSKQNLLPVTLVVGDCNNYIFIIAEEEEECT